MCDHLHSPSSRRQFLGAGLSLLALSTLSPLWAFAPDTPPSPNTISGDSALRRLMEGNARYVANKPVEKNYSAIRAATAKAQHPIAAILSCADSRVAPELVFDQGPGDLFVVRVAGNYLSNDSLASLEYAVGVLGVPLIMVLGHTECGAIKATVEEIKQPAPLPGHIWDIVDAVRPGVANAVKSGGNNVLNNAINANVDYNVMRVASAQPVLSTAAQQHSITVVGGVYELASGKVAMRPAS